MITHFTDLKAWQKSHQLVLHIYKLISKFPQHEVYGLSAQIRRSAISITSNIAEGFGRKGLSEKIQFYYIAVGSISELHNQLIIAKDVDYLSQKEYQHSIDLLIESHKLLNSLISTTKSRKNKTQ